MRMVKGLDSLSLDLFLLFCSSSLIQVLIFQSLTHVDLTFVYVFLPPHSKPLLRGTRRTHAIPYKCVTSFLPFFFLRRQSDRSLIPPSVNQFFVFSLFFYLLFFPSFTCMLS